MHIPVCLCFGMSLCMCLSVCLQYLCLHVCLCICDRLRVCLSAGRTHQLRVHCCSLGHRVIGDFMYSNREDVSPSRMMLHAVRLVIPMKREHISVTARDPFTPDLDPNWRTSQIFTCYDDLSSSHLV